MTDASNKDFVLTGCMIARNDAMDFNMQNKGIWLFYDYRLMTGYNQSGFYPPTTTRQAILVLVWSSD